MVTADPQLLGNKKIKISLIISDTLDSEQVDNKTRKLDKKYDNMSKRAKELYGDSTTARKSLKESQKELINLGIYEPISEGTHKEMLIKMPENKFVKVYESTARQLVTSLSDNAIKVYLYLANNYQIWNIGKKENFKFSKEQLYMEALGHKSKGGYNSDLIEDILTTLAMNGLIAYNIVQKGSKTFYRSLVFVNKNFQIHDKVKENIQVLTKGLQEGSAKEVANIDGKEQVIAEIGFKPDGSHILESALPKFKLFAHTELETYQPIDTLVKDERLKDFTGERAVPAYQLDRLSGAWSDGVNDEYIAYEKKRLGLK